ncbi:hypothetical protein CEQ21_21340 [Niallia circulans]|uniref:Uncharacterized protein n=1 Tax=Niallia circulans TaxID=1397 RepID=A0A553SLU8_NIACI|nr:hypothetical protein CEQ21_21340 [Niallia circulans]
MSLGENRTILMNCSVFCDLFIKIIKYLSEMEPTRLRREIEDAIDLPAEGVRRASNEPNYFNYTDILIIKNIVSKCILICPILRCFRIGFFGRKKPCATEKIYAIIFLLCIIENVGKF